MCYFLLNILSICKGFLSYSAFQFSPVSATWGILLLYPMCVVNNQIKKTCLSLGAGWRTLWFYLLYFFLFKCLCFLATICIFFQFLLNMIRIYICCLNSCDAKILLGPILWYIHECALQTAHIPGVSVEFAVSLHMAFWVQRNLYMNKECRTGHMLDCILIKHLLCFNTSIIAYCSSWDSLHILRVYRTPWQGWSPCLNWRKLDLLETMLC